MELQEILGVLHGWIGLEIEVSAHGGGGRAPISAISSRGRLRTGDVLSRPGASEVFLFVLVDSAGIQIGSFVLYAEAAAAAGSTERKRSLRSRPGRCSY
jgi:hypothetical protein